MAARPLRILCLPGFRQTPQQLQHALQRAGWDSALANAGAELCFARAPPGAASASAPPEWWNASDDGKVYAGWQRGLRSVRAALEANAPCDALLGFSQGGTCAQLFMAIAEREGGLEAALGEAPAGGEQAQIAPLRLIIGVGCGRSRADDHQAFLSSPLKTPALAVCASGDRIVKAASTQRWAACFRSADLLECDANTHRPPDITDGANLHLKEALELVVTEARASETHGRAARL